MLSDSRTSCSLQKEADKVIRGAEAARDAAQDIVFAYGSAADPNGTGVAVSSEFGILQPAMMPSFPQGRVPQRTSEHSSENSHNISQSEFGEGNEDNGVPCIPRGSPSSSTMQLPPGVVVVTGDCLLVPSSHACMHTAQLQQETRKYVLLHSQ
jgi:hypothetical protein